MLIVRILIPCALLNFGREDFEASDWGFAVKAITQQMRIENQLKDSLGVYVTGVKRVGPADVGGLRRGDVIVSINKEPVYTLADFALAYNEMIQDHEKALFSVRRGGALRLVVVNFEKAPEGESLDG